MNLMKLLPHRTMLKAAAAAMALAVAFPAVSHATVFTFLLHDHPDGALAAPEYGLRLDGLFGDNSKKLTFSFDQPGAGVTLRYDNVSNTVRISGRAYGGIDVGGTWDSGNVGFVDLDFTYRQNLTTDGAGTWGSGGTDLGVVVTEDAQVLSTGNSGSLTLGAGTWGSGKSAGDLFTLVDQDDGNFSFKFNNFDDHRLAGHAGYGGPGTFVGWGWVNHGPGAGLPGSHVYSSDWLFTGELTTTSSEISEPAGMAALMALAFAGFVRYRRRGAV